MSLPGPQGAPRIVARYGTFQMIDVIRDSDHYSIWSSTGQIRVRIFDPQNAGCADLTNAQLRIEGDGLLLFDETLKAQCPYVFLDGGGPQTFLIELTPPESSGSVLTIPYVLAADVAPVVCGDGAVEGGEACDDGNTIIGDGCSACSLEPGYGYLVEGGIDAPLPPLPPGAEELTFVPYRIGMDDPRDEGFAIVPASINYFGNHYAGIMVHVNGYLSLHPDLTADGGLGSAAAPGALIAPFASDLVLDDGAIFHYTELSASGTIHFVRYERVRGRRANGDRVGPFTFVVAISENGEVRFHHDQANPNAVPNDWSWVGGIDDATGRFAYPLKDCTDHCLGPPTETRVDFLPR